MRLWLAFCTTVAAAMVLLLPARSSAEEQMWGFGWTRGERLVDQSRPWSEVNHAIQRRAFRTAVMDMGVVRDPSYASATTNTLFCAALEAPLSSDDERLAYGCRGGLYFRVYRSLAEAEAALAREIAGVEQSNARYASWGSPQVQITVLEISRGQTAAPVLRVAPSDSGGSPVRSPGMSAATTSAAVEDDREIEETTDLNRQVLESDLAIQRANAQATAAHQTVVAEHERQAAAHRQEVARAAAARQVYEAGLAEHARRRAQWEADVAACNAGDRQRCASTPH